MNNSGNNIKKEETIFSIEKDGDLKSSDVSQTYQSQILNQLNISTKIKTKYTGKGVKIAILDSGIDISHEDLSIKDEVSFLNTEDTSYSTGHGTHVAGIIGAKPTNNGSVEGIAPETDLFSIKILNERDVGKNSILISAIDWCLDNKMDIVHTSISSQKRSKIVNYAVQKAYDKGILLISSAGNQGMYLKESITFPGAYDSVIAVGSVDQNNKRSVFSSVGESLELMAPGENIYSTEPNNSYGQRDGTSMAAPYITGIAALIMEKNPKLTNKEVRKILNETADEIGEPFLYGNGIVNAQKALLQVK
ncbi:subtilisin [Oikeobacillus pervagus]|uniref:Subtilisin n=1 Tax=Oikeobacillus pervagus TaxID=1325931 RepID=A0AAJ1T856_9BACI|nr:S8 family peptidase [Oikeobacillus pervagus]MDQ0216906.1 subtilisin [Oikeobacillus pervagus]